MQLIGIKRSIIVACDISSIDKFERLVAETSGVPGVGGYKIGLQLALKYGLPQVVRVAKAHTELPLIYDHQKAGTDIPTMGTSFAEVCSSAGINAVILFPLTGPETEQHWVRECKRLGLHVLVGGLMTHRAFLSSEGGFVLDAAPVRIFDIAANLSITDFVVPGNKPSSVVTLRRFLDAKSVPYTFYAPGFITQGGDISECGRVAGERWHAIVGSAIYSAASPRKAAERLTRQILKG